MKPLSRTSRLPPRCRASRRGRAGFTLIELMVAMVAGMTVALAAFALARNATRFFQHEARVSAAQLSVSLGITRLTSDMQRAAFMSTPNMQRDPLRCAATMVGWPSGLQALAGIQIVKQGSVQGHPNDLAQSIANGFNPDSVIIGGAFDTTEQFPVRYISPAGAGVDVYLATSCGAMQRIVNGATQGSASLQTIFATGRFLRIVDMEGNNEYGVITALDVQGQPPTTVIVHLNGATFPQQKKPNNTCGYAGLAVGVLANPITRMLYDIRSLAADPVYKTVVAPPPNAASAALSGDAGRTELVRVELDSTGNEIPGTLSLVSEYAVDMVFGLAVASQGINPAITRYPIALPRNDLIYSTTDVVTGGASRPERARAVQVRLSTRTRAPDRDTDLPVGSDGRRFRFQVDPGLPDPKFARLRTLYADVTLPNLAGVTW